MNDSRLFPKFLKLVKWNVGILSGKNVVLTTKILKGWA